jgi:lipopolysaccharide export system protein LptC
VQRDTHSRLIRAASLILPLAALGLMSTLFLLAGRANPDDALPYAEVDVSARAREGQLTAPRMAGVTQGGAAFTVEAMRARPDPDDPRVMSADAPVLLVDDPAGGRARLTAARAEIDTGARRVALDGGVAVTTDRGWSLGADRLEGTLGALDLTGTGDVRGRGPMGEARADALRLTDGPDGPVLRLTGGVELVYLPPLD